MDLLELNDILAKNANVVDIGKWYKKKWQKRMFRYFHKNLTRIPINDTWFTVGDNHVELYDGSFVQDPYTELKTVKGDIMTLSLVANIVIKGLKVEGKICIRHPAKSPIYSKYELNLISTDMSQHVGFVLCGDELMVNQCKYDFSNFEITVEYCHKTKVLSMFNDEEDKSKRNLLERHIVEYVTTDLGYMILRLTKQAVHENARFVSALYRNGQEVRSEIRNHNRITHKAFKNLAIHLLNGTNELIKRSSTKLYIPKIYGLTDDQDLKVFTCYINNLNILGYEQREQTYHIPFEVIISQQDDCVILHVPVRFWELVVHYTEIKDEPVDDEIEYKDKLTFRTGEAHFILSIRRVNKTQVEFQILRFKIISFRAIGNHPIRLSLDHIVASAVENYIESVIEKTFDDKRLHELAIHQNIDLSANKEKKSSDDDDDEDNSEQEEE